MTYLTDVNVWIALASDRHIHHPAAKELVPEHWNGADRLLPNYRAWVLASPDE
jgi:predicted nucleic acid-binding protein